MLFRDVIKLCTAALLLCSAGTSAAQVPLPSASPSQSPSSPCKDKPHPGQDGTPIEVGGTVFCCDANKHCDNDGEPPSGSCTPGTPPRWDTYLDIKDGACNAGCGSKDPFGDFYKHMEKWECKLGQWVKKCKIDIVEKHECVSNWVSCNHAWGPSTSEEAEVPQLQPDKITNTCSPEDIQDGLNGTY